MGETFVTTVDLVLPGRVHSVAVTPKWGIEIDGREYPAYAPEDAIVFSALCTVVDKVVGLEQLPSLTSEVYTQAVGSGANKVMTRTKEKKSNFPNALSRTLVRGAIAHLSTDIRGPLTRNIYTLRHLTPVAYLLCSDISTENYGLEIINSGESGFEGEYSRCFVNQHRRHVAMSRFVARGRLDVPRQPVSPVPSPNPKPTEIITPIPNPAAIKSSPPEKKVQTPAAVVTPPQRRPKPPAKKTPSSSVTIPPASRKETQLLKDAAVPPPREPAPLVVVTSPPKPVSAEASTPREGVKTPKSTLALPSSSPKPLVTARKVAAPPSKESIPVNPRVTAYKNEVLAPFLSGIQGVSMHTESIVSTMKELGASVSERLAILSLLDRCVGAGLLTKRVDPKNDKQFIYTRTGLVPKRR